MAFNPDAYLQKKSGGGFNPDAYLSKKGVSMAPPADDPSQSKFAAGAAGAANGATLGFADEAGALGSTAMNAITGFSGPLAGGSIDDLVSEYQNKRDELRSALGKIKQANPKTYLAGELAGGVASGGLAGDLPKSLGGAVSQGGKLGAVAGLGGSNADLTRGEIGDASLDAAKGAGIGMGGGAIGYGIGKGISSLADGSLSSRLKKIAEKNAVKATGATGKQISNFDDNAGRELLDRGIVQFGDTPANISSKAQAALDEAHGHIDSALKELDAKGVTASADNVVGALESKISSLKKDPSQADIVGKLEGIVDNIKATGESNPTISAAESTKRGYNRIAGNWMDPEKGQAGKEAYQAYRNEVERAAEAADPSLADKFIEAKKTHGLIAPIQEAAERRANTLQQSPVGGLGDISAAGAGFIKGGPIGAVVAPVARRLIAPRAASSIAVTSDKLADVLAQSPEAFGKFAPVLQDAAQRGSRALSAANDLLQKDPQYLQMLHRVALSTGDLSSDSSASVSTPPVSSPFTEIGKEERNPAEQLKGEAKWMQDGADKLGIDASEITSKSDKQLLIEASDLPPNSKRLQSIKNQLQGRGK